jgi:predicted DNA-binding transcriptional regulator AlpA
MNKKLTKLKKIADEKGYLTSKDVAEFLGLSTARLYAIKDQRPRVPAYYIIGKKLIRYDFDEVMKWYDKIRSGAIK